MAKQYTVMYCSAMFIPLAVENPPGTWVYPAAPGAEFTIVYSDPVPIRELAADIGVTMSFLHRKAREGALDWRELGNQIVVSPAVADQIRAFYADNQGRKRWWPKKGFRDPGRSGRDQQEGAGDDSP